MEVDQIRTADDVERYIEGCLNDFEAGVSTKEETLHILPSWWRTYIRKQRKRNEL